MIYLVRRFFAIIISTTLFYLLNPSSALAATFHLCPDNVAEFGPFKNLCAIDFDSLDNLISGIITTLIIIAIVISIIFLIIGGLKWIISGGDKSAVEGARNTIVAAIIGLIIALLAFFIIKVVLGFLGVNEGSFAFPKLF